jgi:hypothetical protein
VSRAVVKPDRYAFYWRALAGDTTGWDDEGAPFPGYWRARYSAGDLWRPVAIWDVNGLPYAEIGKLKTARGMMGSVGFERTEISALRAWSDLRCWQYAVTEAAFHHAMKHGNFEDSLIASDQHREATGRAIVGNLRDAAAVRPPKREGSK